MKLGLRCFYTSGGVFADFSSCCAVAPGPVAANSVVSGSVAICLDASVSICSFSTSFMLLISCYLLCCYWFSCY